MPANNRFSDNPFRDPNLTPEQVERIEKRNEALRIYRETGDEGPAIEIGLFPKREISCSGVPEIVPAQAVCPKCGYVWTPSPTSK